METTKVDKFEIPEYQNKDKTIYDKYLEEGFRKPNKLEKPENSGFEKREIRKRIGKLLRALLYYLVIMYSVVMLDIIVKSLQIMFKYKDESIADAKYMQMTEEAAASGTSMIVAICIGIFVLFLIFRKQDFTSRLFVSSGEKMNVVSFLMILSVFISAQLVFQFVGIIVEYGLNLFGYSALAAMESASSTSTTVSMFLYASVLGPITEELVFRGFILRGLEKYGKGFAILVSSFLFGAFHGNFVQGFFAAAIGMVLAYVALEYSLKWSIVLHIFNNMIYCDFLSYATSNLPEASQALISYAIEGVFLIVAIILFIQNRTACTAYIKREKRGLTLYKTSFTSFWMICYLVIMFFLGLLGIEKI